VLIQNDGRKKHTSSKKMRRGWLSRKIKWWVLEKKQVGSQLEGKRIHIHVHVEHQRNENRKVDNDSKCDTYITRGRRGGGGDLNTQASKNFP